MRLIQLHHPDHGRRIARVEDPELVLIDASYRSCYSLFEEIIKQGAVQQKFISGALTAQTLNYDSVYEGTSGWQILPAFDRPEHPSFCMLSGTGLTHRASAENRQRMHQQMEGEAGLTDSMQIYLWGEQGGKPGTGAVGVQPEWFYKGSGTMLKGFGESLEVPSYADDGGEEPEIAGLYMISPDGIPYRVGFAVANEFSDHVMEKKNYLYLAPSKLRNCAVGPELVLENDFQDLSGKVAIIRDDRELWSKDIRSGEQNMSHSLENLEYHHFKYDQHRLPGMVHIHFFGADAFSFGEDIRLQDGDRMRVSFEGFGRPLLNPLHVSNGKEQLVAVRSFD